MVVDDNPAICRPSQALNRSSTIIVYLSCQTALSFTLGRFVRLIFSMAAAGLGAVSTSEMHLSQLTFIFKNRRFVVILVGNLTHEKGVYALFLLFYSFVNSIYNYRLIG